MRSQHPMGEDTGNRFSPANGGNRALILIPLVAVLPLPLFIAFVPSVLPLFLLGATTAAICGLVTGWWQQRRWTQQQREGSEAKGYQEFFQQCEPKRK